MNVNKYRFPVHVQQQFFLMDCGQIDGFCFGSRNTLSAAVAAPRLSGILYCEEATDPAVNYKRNTFRERQTCALRMLHSISVCCCIKDNWSYHYARRVNATLVSNVPCSRRNDEAGARYVLQKSLIRLRGAVFLSFGSRMFSSFAEWSLRLDCY